MPNDIGIGALGYVGYALETVEGTRVAPSKFLAAQSVNFNDSNDYLNPLQIRGIRDTAVAMPAPFQIAGTMEMEWVPEDVGNILKSAFAATVSTGAYTGGGYTHTFAPTAGTSPTMSFETFTGGGANGLIMAYTGVRVNTFELKGAFGEIVSASLGLDGVGRAKQASAATPTYKTSSFYPFHFNGAKVQIGGSDNAFVKEFTFGVNNNVEHIGTIRKTRNYYRVALGPREMTLGMSLDFQDTSEYDRLLNDTEFAVSIVLETTLPAGSGIGTAGNSQMSLTIAMPRVKYRTVGVPISASDFITQDVEATILKPTGATDICTVTLSNSETGAVLVS
jgi:hypothetical protein